MSKPSAHLSDALFSGTKQKVLGLLFGNPDRSFYANELITLAQMGSGSVQRELATLHQTGLVSRSARGNQKHYQANPNSPLFDVLCEIVQKTFGLAEPLRDALAPLAPQITAAFVFGSVAKRTDTASSDIDLMVLSEKLTYADLFGVLDQTSEVLGRPINPTILTQKELTVRIARQESFITRVLEQPKIWIIGSQNDFAISESDRS